MAAYTEFKSTASRSWNQELEITFWGVFKRLIRTLNLYVLKTTQIYIQGRLSPLAPSLVVPATDPLMLF